MSTVRMCDGCGLIFPEGAEGTSTGMVTVIIKDDRGRTSPDHKAADYCQDCTNGTTRRQPRVIAAIEKDNKTGDGQALYADTMEDDA